MRAFDGIQFYRCHRPAHGVALKTFLFLDWRSKIQILTQILSMQSNPLILAFKIKGKIYINVLQSVEIEIQTL